MREQIKTIATDLLIMHGCRGLRFADIAETLQITRANIHYHFGTKANLIEEVIEDYLSRTLKIMGSIWTGPAPYAEKILETMEFNRSRYDRFNRGGADGRPWSLISRMRLEADLLSPKARAHLRDFSERMDRLVGNAVAQALENGELAPNAPLHDVAVQAVSIIDSAGSITQDAGSFARLEQLYHAHIRLVDYAFGERRKPAKARAKRAAPTATAG